MTMQLLIFSIVWNVTGWNWNQLDDWIFIQYTVKYG